MNKLSILILFSILILPVAYSYDSNSTLLSEWKMFGRTLDGNRYYPGTVNMSNFGLLWSYEAGDYIQTNPTFFDEVVYFGSNDQNIYALNATNGDQLWNFSTNQIVTSSPAIADNKIYFSSWDGIFYALNLSTREQLWNLSTNGWLHNSPVIAQGIVYFGGTDNHTYALNATNGNQLWNYSTRGWIASSLVISDKKIYFGSTDNNTYCLNSTDGIQLWNFTMNNSAGSSASISGGKVFMGSYDNNLYALNASDGNQLWNFTASDDVLSSPSISEDTVYVGSNDNNLYALNASDGNQLWNFTASDDIVTSPAITNGILFFGGVDNKTYALNTTNGDMLWNFTTGDDVRSSPTIIDSVLYIGSNDNNLYVFSARSDNEPSILLNLPLDNYNTTTDDIDFNFTASDDFDTIIVCNLTIDGKVNLSNISIQSGIAQVNSTYNMSDNTYLWNVTCWDSNNNTNSSETRSFTVDTIAPVCHLNGTSTSTISSGDSIYIFANYSDSGTGIKKSELIVNGLLNKTNNTGTLSDSPFIYNFSYVPAHSQIGIFNFTINATDYAGNENSTQIMQVNITDGKPPSVELSYPQNNFNWSSRNLTLYVNVTDNYDHTVYCNLTLAGLVNETINDTSISETEKTLLFTLNGLTESQYSWNVTCWDTSNNINDTATTRTFTIDTTPPTTAPNITLVNDSNQDGNLEINWTDQDAMQYGIFRHTQEFNSTTIESSYRIANVSQNTFIDNTTEHGQTYWYAVSSIDYAGNENISVLNISTSINNATTNDTIRPKIPSTINVTQSGNTAHISWSEVLHDVNDNPDFQGLTYRLWRSTSINTSKQFVNQTLAHVKDISFSDGNSTTLSITSSGRYYFAVTCKDDADNENLTLASFANISLSYSEPSDDNDGSNTGSGGGNLDSIKVMEDSYSRAWSSLEDNLTVIIDKKLLPVSYVYFDIGGKASNLHLDIEAYGNQPEHLNRFTYLPYRFLKFKVDSYEGDVFSGHNIKFKVNNSWLSKFSIKKEDVVLFKYIDDKWVDIKTDLLEEKEHFTLYGSSPPGFSYFVIGTKKFSDPIAVSNEENPKQKGKEDSRTQEENQQKDGSNKEETSEQKSDNPTPSEDRNVFRTIMIVVITLFLSSLSIFFIIKLKNDKKVEKLLEMEEIQSIPPELFNYIKTELSKNFSKEDIEKALLSKGWKKDQIKKAFEKFKNQKPLSSRP